MTSSEITTSKVKVTVSREAAELLSTNASVQAASTQTVGWYAKSVAWQSKSAAWLSKSVGWYTKGTAE